MSIARAKMNAAANGDTNAMISVVRDLDDRLAAVETQATLPSPGEVPAFAAIAIAGVDGHFKATITEPDAIPPLGVLGAQDNPPAVGTLFHQLQSATAVTFDAAANVITYGGDNGSQQLQYDIIDPNQTKFWRYRSSFDGQNWNQWNYLQDPAVCGVVPVWSGLLKTASLSYVNSAAQTTDGSVPITQSGTSTQINIAAKTWNVGTQQIAYLGGSVDPGSYGTFYVYGIDVKKAGGTITYLTTQNAGILTAQDGIIVFGFVTTAAGGGGTGDGGGSCDVTDAVIDMYDGSQKASQLIVKGDAAMGADGGPEVAQEDAAPVPNVPVFRLEFSDGTIHRGASSTHWLRRQGGQRSSVFEAVEGDFFRLRAGVIATLTTKTFLGLATVWRQRFDRTRTYIVDGVEAHNLKPAPEL